MEVQRQALLSTRRMVVAMRGSSETTAAQLMEPHLPTLIPPMCAIAASTSGACPPQTGCSYVGYVLSSDYMFGLVRHLSIHRNV